MRHDDSFGLVRKCALNDRANWVGTKKQILIVGKFAKAVPFTSGSDPDLVEAWRIVYSDTSADEYVVRLLRHFEKGKRTDFKLSLIFYNVNQFTGKTKNVEPVFQCVFSQPASCQGSPVVAIKILRRFLLNLIDQARPGDLTASTTKALKSQFGIEYSNFDIVEII